MFLTDLRRISYEKKWHGVSNSSMRRELGKIGGAEHIGACEFAWIGGNLSWIELEIEGYRVIFTTCWRVTNMDKACIMYFGEPDGF
jgi:hypothetical protein